MQVFRTAFYLLAATLLLGCTSCAKPRMPEPEEPFKLYSDYSEWTDSQGYPSGELIPEEPDGLFKDKFMTRPGGSGYSSGRIVVGDSRCCQMGIYEQRAGADEYAVFAAWGGHYLPAEPYLASEEFYSAIESCFKEQIRAKGRCELFFFATVNDYDYSGEYNGSGISAAIAFAERLASMRFEYKGKEYAPAITVIGIAGAQNESFNGYIDEFNALLENAVRDSAILNGSSPRYTTVPEILGGEIGFIDDGLHYDDGTLKALAEFICK